MNPQKPDGHISSVLSGWWEEQNSDVPSKFLKNYEYPRQIPEGSCIGTMLRSVQAAALCEGKPEMVMYTIPSLL